MPLIIILMCLIAGSVSSCDAAHAFSVEQMADYKGQRLDLSVQQQIKAYVCKELDCPKHITVDQFKVSGHQLAALHLSIHYNFD